MKLKIVGGILALCFFTQCQNKLPQIESDVVVKVNPDYQSAEYKFETQEDSLSYLMAAELVKNLSQSFGEDLNKEALLKGVMTGLKQGNSEVFKDTAVTNFMQTYSRTIAEKKQAEIAEKNIREGKDFLDANAKNEGVIVTESGLQYRVINAGVGKKPTPTNTVKCAYKGTLIDGTVFDQSEETDFGVTQVIQGWQEALQMMSVGSKWELVIPSELAYGERAMGQMIQPHSVLVFEMELLDIVK